MKSLGTIVDLQAFKFSVASSRAKKLRLAIARIQAAVKRDWKAVSARLIASFIGLIWSIASCCHRAASIMARAITAVLTSGLNKGMLVRDMPLKTIVNRFWAGTVAWTQEADHQLAFWAKVCFENLSAPISADVLGIAVEQAFWYPERFNAPSMSFLFQDASATASGGGFMQMVDGVLQPGEDLFLAEFSAEQAEWSSTLRELLGMLWCLRATGRLSKQRIVFICDNWQSCRAILRGSRVQQIQRVAELIFTWCLENGRVCWPIWVPRTHRLITEADRRSRLFIPHDDRSPPQLVKAANEWSVSLWRACLSFDQAASHMSAIVVGGRTLPFNAFCFQPGAAGIDMFLCLASWRGNVNYVFPPEPMVGRLFTFLPSTLARSIVVVKEPVHHSWWSYAIQRGAAGLVGRKSLFGFAMFAFDFTA